MGARYGFAAETRVRAFASLVAASLGSSEPLAGRVRGGASAFAALAWHATVAERHARTGQPVRRVVEDAQARAESLVDDLVARLSWQRFDDWRRTITPSGVQFSEADHAGLLEDAVGFVTRDNVLSAVELSRVEREVVAVLVACGRDGRWLEQDLAGYRTQRLNASDLVQLFLPEPKAYRVALGVEGVRELDAFEAAGGLSLLRPGRGGGLDRWGSSGGEVHSFLSSFESGETAFGRGVERPGPSLFCDVLVAAHDPGHAAERGRRELDEVIHRYVAAHPSARVAVTSVALVKPEVGKQLEVHRFVPPVVPRIEFFSAGPPSKFDAALRLNAVARDAPLDVARAAFSWAAFESTGVDTRLKRESVSKSLALLSLRQVAFLAYRSAITGSNAGDDRLGRTGKYLRITKKRVATLERAQGRSGANDQAEIAHKLRAQRSRLAALERLMRIYGSRAEQQRKLINQLRVTDASLTFGSKGFAVLRDFERWMSLLRRHALGECNELSDLLVGSTLESRLRLEAAANIFRADDALAQYLADSRSHYVELLDGLFAARNMYFHVGEAPKVGLRALGSIGPAMIDSYLELLAYWGESEGDSDVPQELAERFDAATSSLAQGKGLGYAFQDLISPM